MRFFSNHPVVAHYWTQELAWGMNEAWKLGPNHLFLGGISLCLSSLQEMKGSHLFSYKAKTKVHFHVSCAPQVGKLTLVFMRWERDDRRSRQSQFVAKYSVNNLIKTPTHPKLRWQKEFLKIMSKYLHSEGFSLSLDFKTKTYKKILSLQYIQCNILNFKFFSGPRTFLFAFSSSYYLHCTKPSFFFPIFIMFSILAGH